MLRFEVAVPTHEDATVSHVGTPSVPLDLRYCPEVPDDELNWTSPRIFVVDAVPVVFPTVIVVALDAPKSIVPALSIVAVASVPFTVVV
jgi:hypothetical protein